MAITSSNDGRASSWRDWFAITRIGIFSVVFIVAGLAMLFHTPSVIPGDVSSTLRFPHRGGLGFDLVVPTVPYALVVGLSYLLGGLFGLFAPSRYERVKTIWLIVNGVLIIPTVMVLAAAGKATNMVSMLAASFRLATPIIIGAMAGIWCERSGVINIAIEGMMLTAACFGLVAYTYIALMYPGEVGQWMGIGVAVLSGGLMALLHAWLSVTFKTDQIISGTVINIFALGITAFARTELLINADASVQTLREIRIPLLSELPVLGEVLFSGKPIFFSMFIVVILTHVMLYYTRWGLRTRAVGENPHAADTLGINVPRNRYINVIIGGMIAGLAGAWFTIETAGTFREAITSGTGFIALAAMIFGKWTPAGAMAGGLLFGFSQALDTRFQFLEVGVPVQFIQMTPYIVTMVVLAGLVGRAIPPKAIGKPYSKE
ncbi:MAG: ABC transporter permease [Anaerolineaceae bacterium]|nr:MAG: ABC transporter permease [Anaerolineaceae bacterium]